MRNYEQNMPSPSFNTVYFQDGETFPSSHFSVSNNATTAKLLSTTLSHHHRHAIMIKTLQLGVAGSFRFDGGNVNNNATVNDLVG